MSIRNIRKSDDEILKKKSKEVKQITDNIKILIEDMKDTMIQNGGCGIAAVQVGVLKNIILVQPKENEEVYLFINPQIISKSDETNEDFEGCLSVDKRKGIVKRPNQIVLKYLDIDMNEKQLTANDFFARAICHEVDHLNGVLFTEKVVGKLYTDEEFAKYLEEIKNK